MKKNICPNCGSEIVLNTENGNSCSECGFVMDENYFNIDSYNNEIDAIIDSVLEEAIEVKHSKIINKNDDEKRLCVSEDNCVIEINKDKCINCGICKKTCENLANLEYDLKKIDKPICTGCGQCALSCPSKAILFKKEYRKVKDVLDENKKIVAAIVSPSVYSMVKEIYNINDYNEIEKRLVGGLRKLGFDFIFNSSFGSDILVLEETTEIIERLGKKNSIPFLTSNCPSWVKYAQVYHPELLDKLSPLKNQTEIQNEIIKEFFAQKKGFEKDRIVTVSISNCVARKMEKKESKLDTDYFITSSELALLLSEEEIDLKHVDYSNFDNLAGESSGSGALFGVSGGHLESLIRTIYRIINKKDLAKDEIDIYELRGYEDIREANIQLDSLKLKVAVVSDMKGLEKLLENDMYKKYHLIEVMYCKGGCIGGSGQVVGEEQYNKQLTERSSDIYNIDKNSKNRFSYNNKEVKELYKKFLDKPKSEVSIRLFHREFKNNN